jgi:predicted ATPase
VEQGEGDSVVGAFARGSDAVAAAVAVQRAFLNEPWPDGAALRVRMALHTGEAHRRDDGTYDGLTLNRCARLRALAHGGQVLMSAATTALVADRPPPGIGVVDLGVHRLKDLSRPEHVWQVTHPDLPSEFPPLRSLDAFRHNLPVQLTPLIGRTAEVADLANWLSAERLVTLTGSGGVGKTRLAAAVAAETVDQFRGGVWWVELAAIVGGDSVGRSVLAALGGREQPGASLVQQLSVELGDQPTLVVLDNCEHVVAHCAELVVGVMMLNRSVSVLATSREPLGVPGEVTWRVPSLPSPGSDAEIDVETLLRHDAALLFVDRARRVHPSFVVDSRNTAAVAQICHRLDGIPLAVELAAARCRHMSVHWIAAELDDRFRVLTGGARTAAARQQTLAASVEWSHDRLDDRERKAFRRLGVFAGPFPLDAAEALVACPRDIERVDVVGIVSQLVDKSLVIADDSGDGEPRYRLLETLRAYAVDQARRAGELDLVRRTHAVWWSNWLESRGNRPTPEVLSEVEEFHDNLRAALDWSIPDPPVGLVLIHLLARFWDELGRQGELLEIADRLLTDENATLHPSAWLPAAAECAPMAGYPVERTIATLAQVGKVAAELGDDYYAVRAAWLPGRDPAQCVVLRDLALTRGDRYQAACATVQWCYELAEDDPKAAAAAIIELDAAIEAGGSPGLRDFATLVHAIAARSRGDLRRCVALIRETLATSRAPMVTALNPLSFAALLLRDRDSVCFAVELGDRLQRMMPGTATWVDIARHRLGLLDGHPSIMHPDLLERENGWPITSPSLWLAGRETIDAGAGDVAVDAVRARARPDPHCLAVAACVTAAGTKNSRHWLQALTLAVDNDLRLIAVDALEGLAVSATGNQRWREALVLLGAAERLRHETGYQWLFAFEERARSAAHISARVALGDRAETELSRGRLMEWSEAARYAFRNGVRPTP